MRDSTRPARSSPLGESWPQDLGRTASEMLKMLSLRRKLAEAEIRCDVSLARRTAIAGGVGLIVALTGLPVLVVSLSMQLEGWLGANSHVASILSGVLLLAAGLMVLCSAWKRFRRDFLGLRESLSELKEDLVWLREWVENQDTDDE